MDYPQEPAHQGGPFPYETGQPPSSLPHNIPHTNNSVHSTTHYNLHGLSHLSAPQPFPDGASYYHPRAAPNHPVQQNPPYVQQHQQYPPANPYRGLGHNEQQHYPPLAHQPQFGGQEQAHGPSFGHHHSGREQEALSSTHLQPHAPRTADYQQAYALAPYSVAQHNYQHGYQPLPHQPLQEAYHDGHSTSSRLPVDGGVNTNPQTAAYLPTTQHPANDNIMGQSGVPSTLGEDYEMTEASVIHDIASAVGTLYSGIGAAADVPFGGNLEDLIDSDLFNLDENTSFQYTMQPSTAGGFSQPELPGSQAVQQDEAPLPYTNQVVDEPHQQPQSQAHLQDHHIATHSSSAPDDPSLGVPQNAGGPSVTADNIPTYWAAGATAAPPQYSPLSVTIFQPKPFRPVVLSRITSVLSPQPSSNHSGSSPTMHRRANVPISPTGQRPALIPTFQGSGSGHHQANVTSPQQSTVVVPGSAHPKPIILSVHGYHQLAPPEGGAPPPGAMSGGGAAIPGVPSGGGAAIPGVPSGGEAAIPGVPSGGGAHVPGASSTQPANTSEAHHAPHFSLLPVEEATGNPVYNVKNPYSASIGNFANWLAIPLLWHSVQASVLDPVMNEVLAKNTIRHSLGWQQVVMMILYYRAFYFEILKIPPTLFPPLLSKDDVIDSGLVLIVSSWIINLLAMRLCGRRTPSAASVKHFVDTCLNSLEITVLLSIAGQINLTIYSLEDIEEKGWLGLFTPVPLEYYTRRVADPVKHKVLEFFFEGCLGIYEVYLRNMQTPRIVPDIAYKWGADFAMVKSAIQSSLTGNNIHLILKDPSSQKYINDHEKHGTYTVQDGSDIAEETIDAAHACLREGKPVPPDNIHLFRNVNIDSGANFIIGHIAKGAPLALTRTLTGKNPYIDSSNDLSRQMPFIGLLPFIVGHLEAAYSSLRPFGSRTSPEKIIGSAELEDAYQKKGECMRVWLTEACLGRTTESNIPDLEWINESMRLKFADAARSLDGTRKFRHAGRSEYIVWDPYIPWSGKSQDFLSYYTQIGSTPAATEDGEIFEGKFVQSPLTELYDDIARQHEKKRVDHEKAASDAKETSGGGSESKVSVDDLEMDESLGTEVIFKMAHITKELAGKAWPMIQKGLAGAQQRLVVDKKTLDGLLQPSPPQS